MGRHILPKSGAFSTVTAPTSEQQDSKFLNLPPEIRNRIYGYAFSSPVRKWPGKAPNTKKNKRAGASIAPPPVMVSKQLHAEALPIFYAKTTFLFSHPSRFKLWARAIGHQRCQMLRDVLIMPESSWRNMHGWVFSAPRKELVEFAENCGKLLVGLEYLNTSIKRDVVKIRVPVAEGKGAKLLAWTASPEEIMKDRLDKILESPESRFLLVDALHSLMDMDEARINEQARLPLKEIGKEDLTVDES